MKKIILVFLSVFLNIFFVQHATAAIDKGRITLFFASGSGSMAIQLDSGFPNAISEGECPTANSSGYAGVAATVDPILKSSILAAKASNAEVTMVTKGCEVGGGWYKILDIYIH